MRVNSRKRLFSSVHSSVNFWKISCLPVFAGIFLYFLGQGIRVNSRKRLLSGVHRTVNGWKIGRIPTFFSSFPALPGTVGVFGCFSVRIARHRSLTPTPCPRYFCSLYSPMAYRLPMFRELKSIPFPSQNNKNKGVVNSKNMIYLKLCKFTCNAL